MVLPVHYKEMIETKTVPFMHIKPYIVTVWCPAKLQLEVYSSNNYLGEDSFPQFIQMVKTRRHAYRIHTTRHCSMSPRFWHHSLSKFRFQFLRTTPNICKSSRWFSCPLYNIWGRVFRQLGVFSSKFYEKL